MEEKITFTPIGVVTEASGPAPGEGRFFDRREKVEILPAYRDGLTGLAAGDRIQILFHFHLAGGYELVTFARGRGMVTGVFNCHSPNRPNGIGVDEVEIVSITDGVLEIDGGDMLPGTPILDIKPVMGR